MRLTLSIIQFVGVIYVRVYVSVVMLNKYSLVGFCWKQFKPWRMGMSSSLVRSSYHRSMAGSMVGSLSKLEQHRLVLGIHGSLARKLVHIRRRS